MKPLLWLLALLAACCPVYARDAVLTTLHPFVDSEYGSPSSSLAWGTDNALYGVCADTNGAGIAFRVTKQGQFRVIHRFDYDWAELKPHNPRGSLTPAGDGTFYGVTGSGGEHKGGTVFRLTQTGVLTVLYAFKATGFGSDSVISSPNAAPIIGKDGFLYGTTSHGGGSSSLGGCGTIYKLTLGGKLTILHAFQGQRYGPQQIRDGAQPRGALVFGPDGALYGTTADGGNFGGGTVFRITTNGDYTILYDFAEYIGSNPTGSLVVGADRALYGTTESGTIYKITPQGKFTSLHTFHGITNGTGDPMMPYAGLTPGPNDCFYGTTFLGGQGGGTVFCLMPSGNVEMLYQFHADANKEWSDGGGPEGGVVVGKDGALYGTTAYGGFHDPHYSMALFGTIFKLTLPKR